MRKRIFSAKVAALLLLAGITSSANALMQLELSDGTTTIGVTDDGAGDSITGLGSLLYSGSLGVFNLSVTTGVSKPVIGTSLFGELDLNSVNVASNGAGSLTIKLTDTDFLGTTGIENFIALASTTQTGASVNFEFWVDQSNTAFGTGTQIAIADFLSPAQGLPQYGSLDLTGPYSMTIIATLTHNAAGQTTNLSGYMARVPEPNALLLMGIGLVGLGVVRRRKSTG